MDHLAAPFEDHAFVHAEGRGKDLAPEDRWFMDFNPVLGLDAAIDFAADNHDPGFNFTSDTCAFSDNEDIRGINLSPKRPPDSNGALKTKFSFKLTSVIDHAGHIGMGGRNGQVFCRVATHLLNSSSHRANDQGLAEKCNESGSCRDAPNLSLLPS